MSSPVLHAAGWAPGSLPASLSRTVCPPARPSNRAARTLPGVQPLQSLSLQPAVLASGSQLCSGAPLASVMRVELPPAQSDSRTPRRTVLCRRGRGTSSRRSPALGLQDPSPDDGEAGEGSAENTDWSPGLAAERETPRRSRQHLTHGLESCKM